MVPKWHLRPEARHFRLMIFDLSKHLSIFINQKSIMPAYEQKNDLIRHVVWPAIRPFLRQINHTRVYLMNNQTNKITKKYQRK